MGPDALDVALEHLGIGVAQPGLDAVGVVDREQLARRTRGARRAPGSCRPRSGGGARSTRSPGCRSPPTSTGRATRSAAAYASAAVAARPTVTGTVASARSAGEHVVVAVLRRAGDPEADVAVGLERASSVGERDRARDVLARDRAGRLQQHEVVGRESERGARRVAVAAWRVEIERVAERHRGEAAVLELHARVVVDGDVQRVRRGAAGCPRGRRGRRAATGGRGDGTRHGPSCSARTSAVIVDASGLIGSEQRFSTIDEVGAGDACRRARPGSGVLPSTGSMARNGSQVSSGRSPSSSSPATRRTSKPSSRSAHSHLRASTATPSAPPSRYESWTATGASDARLARIGARRRISATRVRVPRGPAGGSSRRAARVRRRRRGRGARRRIRTRRARSAARRRRR